MRQLSATDARDMAAIHAESFAIGERPAGSGVTIEDRKVVVFLAKAGLAAAVFDTTCRAILPSAHKYRDA